MTARSESDLSPEGIVKKVSDASGSKYSTATPNPSSNGPPPPVLSKPAFTPTRSSGGLGGFNPLTSSRLGSKKPNNANVDEDGWGQDAPPVTRTQLEKVQSSYQPTKVNMRELSSQKPEPSRFNGSRNDHTAESSNIVKGDYQPVGKVDIAALRRQAQETSNTRDDRPSVVKGSYEPVGKVDIAAIRARAQKPEEGSHLAPSGVSPTLTGNSAHSTDHGVEEKSFSNRSAPFSSERLISLPKPKVDNRFGSGASRFSGTVAPKPRGFDSGSQNSSAAPPIGIGRTFADQGGKTPAQIWAEKKSRERGSSGGNEYSAVGGPTSPLVGQTSGSGEWKSGYGGKSWAPVHTTRTGQSAGSLGQQHTGGSAQEDVHPSPAGGFGAIRDRFKDAPPIGVGDIGNSQPAPSPPPLDISSKPNAGRGIPLPGLPSRPPQAAQEEEEQEREEEREIPRLPTPPARPPRTPSPPTPPARDSGSPIRVARPVGRGDTQEVNNAREEQFSPPPVMPVRSLAQAVPHEDDLTEEPSGHDPARGAGEAAAAASFGQHAIEHAHSGAPESGKRALVQYDYEKNEDNEVELKEGDYVTNIEMVDEHWWMGQNKHGESGLFPSNYVELVEEEEEEDQHHAPATHAPGGGSSDAPAPSRGYTATAIYDYEAAEGNELSFPEDAKITDVVSTVVLELCNHILITINRNFRTTIGGLENMEGSRGFSLPVMCAWTND